MSSYVIIGASRGLGYEWLRHLSSNEKNTVIGLVRNPTLVKERLTADSISNVHILYGDMVDNISLVAAAEEVRNFTGNSLDFLIINGAYTNSTESLMMPTEFVGKEEMLTSSMTESLKVNVLGVIFSINAFLPLIRRSSIKKIAVISTAMASIEMSQQNNIAVYLTYSAMKAALNMAVTKFAVELKREGVLVLALGLGLVDTSADKPPRHMTPEQMGRLSALMKNFQAQNPNFTGPMTMSDSIKQQKKAIDETSIESTGSFISQYGNKA